MAEYFAPVAQLDRASDYESEGYVFDSCRARQVNREVAQFGSASALGAEGRRFESCLPDHEIPKHPLWGVFLFIMKKAYCSLISTGVIIMKKIKLFELSPFQFFLTSMNGMVYGLFATLIISVILNQLGLLLNFQLTETFNLGTEITKVSGIVRGFLGVGIGVGIAWALKLQGLKLIGAMVIGGLSTASGLVLRADPLVAYVTTISALLIVELVFKKKTPFDIILIPLFSILTGTLFTLLYFQPISSIASAIGEFVNSATTLQPFLMGVIVSVLMGIILTSPFSSAGIAISFGISGLAGGAAVIGCAVHMLGFAVMGRRDNDLGTTISVGLGTSMLQFKNAMKKPMLWLPVIIVSAVLGPVSTMVFQTLTDATGAGMGTSGLVGQFATLSAMEGNLVGALLSIFILQIALPIILVWLVDGYARKLKWYGEGDLKI